MDAAPQHHEVGAVGVFDVGDLGRVRAAVGDQPASRLEQHPYPGRDRCRPQAGGEGVQVEGAFAAPVRLEGHPQPAADVDDPQVDAVRGGRVGRVPQTPADVVQVRGGVEVPGHGVDVEAGHVDPGQ